MLRFKHFYFKRLPMPPLYSPAAVSLSRFHRSSFLSPETSPAVTNSVPFNLKRTPNSSSICCAKARSASTSSRFFSNGFPAVARPIQENNDEADKMNILKHKLKEIGIVSDISITGETQLITCPKCRERGSENHSLSLIVGDQWEFVKWECSDLDCRFRGNIRPRAGAQSTYLTFKDAQIDPPKNVLSPKSLRLQNLSEEILQYFSQRNISKATLLRNRVMQVPYYNECAIAFTYWKDEELVGCKYRTQDKKFWQEKDREKIFYGLDDIKKPQDFIIIVEGEIDKLSMEEAGYQNCVSVPEGAPSAVSDKDLPSKDKDLKYQFLWNCDEYINKASRIFLATDTDAPGEALAEELARRIGKEKCWLVKWPEKNDKTRCKDANEVLVYLGPEALRKAVQDAEMYPISGLFSFRSYFNEIDAYYYNIGESDVGVPTGWTSLNQLYHVVPGELTVVTGVPNSGKSEWIDALMCNLNSIVGWKFALCSMENRVRDHGRKLLEKHVRKPFFNVRYGEAVERMSLQELEEGKKWLNDTFSLIRCEDDSLPNVRWVLEMAKIAVRRYGIRGLVIDPYNELDHQRDAHMTETEYVSQMLTLIKRFAQHHSCHVWFVAHPRQLQQWQGGAPNLYDISGSAHFINKCDNGIVVHRNRDPEAGPLDQVQICVRKVRNKVAGTIGETFLSYDRVTGTFSDLSP